jgi:diheme cytochrome c
MRNILLTLLVVLAPAAMAEGRLAVPQNDRWKAECSSCHIAYPPQLLPAQSWRRLMSGLDRHFGVDASLEVAVAAEIGDFLQRHSGTGKRIRGAGESLRITQSAWFLREHRKVSPKNAASCESCHTHAAQGDFHE